MTHYIKVCTFGHTHEQCRCPSPNKTTKVIKCPTPNLHGPVDAAEGGEVDFLVEIETAERLEQTLHARINKITTDRFWYFTDEARAELNSEIEEAVKQWLIDEATRIRRNHDATLHSGGTTEGS